MVEEIRQDGKVILSSEDGFSVPMIFNNLCGLWKEFHWQRIQGLYQAYSL